MFSLEPPFKILRYENMNTLFGGVELSFEGPYNLRDMIQEVGVVVESIGDSLRRAYEVKTFIDYPGMSSVSTVVKPIESKLDKRNVEIDIGYKSSSIYLIGEIKRVCRNMILQGKDSTFATRNDGGALYLFHMLKDNFDPVSTGDFLKATKAVLLDMAGQKLRKLTTQIKPEYLEVNAKILRDRKYVF